ncbi:MAG: sigma factor [Betaproteobacteria bacterium]|nr:sigma factor [Betaproteobacteria bacterium]
MESVDDAACEDEVEERASPFLGTPGDGEDASQDLRGGAIPPCWNEISRNAPLPTENGRPLAQLAKHGDPTARWKRVAHDFRLVVTIAKRDSNRGLSSLDLTEDGNLGLLRVPKQVDPDRGFPFATDAAWWGRQNIERAIINPSRTIRGPIHLLRSMNTHLRAVHELQAPNGEDPILRQVAQRRGEPVEEVRGVPEPHERIAPLEAPWQFQSSSTRREFLTDEATENASALAAASKVARERVARPFWMPQSNFAPGWQMATSPRRSSIDPASRFARVKRIASSAGARGEAGGTRPERTAC